jgi:hypothetical protein
MFGLDADTTKYILTQGVLMLYSVASTFAIVSMWNRMQTLNDKRIDDAKEIARTLLEALKENDKSNGSVTTVMTENNRLIADRIGVVTVLVSKVDDLDRKQVERANRMDQMIGSFTEAIRGLMAWVQARAGAPPPLGGPHP